MAKIKKILKDSFAEVKEDARLVQEINQENLELVKAINRANLAEARRVAHEIQEELTEDDGEEQTAEAESTEA